MKQIFILIVFLISTNCANAQNNLGVNNNLFFGFNLGINYTNIRTSNFKSTIFVDNNAGFSMGILAGYHLTNSLSLATNTTVSFHNNSLYHESAFAVPYTILQTTLDLSITGVYTLIPSKQKSPYLLLGPSIQIPLNKPVVSTQFSDRQNIALEAGVGLNLKFSEFIVSPELRYAFGLSNVNGNPAIPLDQKINFHTVKLTFHFKSL